MRGAGGGGCGGGGGVGCLQGCRHEDVLHRWMLLDGGGVKGRAGEGKGVRELCVGASGGRGGVVCVGAKVGGGISRIDQALEEADCATFEDEGTITLLGSVSRRRGSQTTRGKAL